MNRICQKCGEVSQGDAKFCRHCGNPFEEKKETPTEPIQDEGNPNAKSWWYVFEGTKNGPCTENDIINLIHSGIIERKTQIWRAGMNHWMDAELSSFKNHFSSIPPQISPEQISDRYAWALAVTPIVASVLLTKIFLGLGIYSNGTSVFFMIVTICLNSVFWIADYNLLKKAGYNSEGWMWSGLFLIPVYLFIRASKINKKYWYAITWCILFAISLFIE